VIIKAEDLTYVYGEGTPFVKTALDHVSLTIEEGEFIGLMGHTGSGKSTLIQHLNGLLRPTSGKIWVEGEELWSVDKARLRDIRFKVGLVFQFPEYQLFEETIYKDIAFGPRNMGLSEDEVEVRVREAMDFVGLPWRMADKSPFDVSGGQKRRVAIAGVLAMEPKVLVLDEPVAGLDPRGREDLLSKIKNYHKSVGNTVILVSHSMEDVAKTVDRILVMDHAHLAMDGTPREIFARSEELTAMGLDIPRITRICQKLRQRGIDLGSDILTVEEARDALLARLGGEGTC
jgi:energy-coupling factor transport system ATP-binding protein